MQVRCEAGEVQDLSQTGAGDSASTSQIGLGLKAAGRKDAIEVENYEAVDMYPRFIEISIEEGLVNVTQSFQ